MLGRVLHGVVLRCADVWRLAARLEGHCSSPVRTRTSSHSGIAAASARIGGWQAMSSARSVVVLGSTGSIGTQAIDVVMAAPDRFRVVAVAAGGSDVATLARQAAQLRVSAVGLSRSGAADELQ